MIKNVGKAIGKILKNSGKNPIILIKSTVTPGTIQKIILPIIQKYKIEEKKVIKVIKLNNQKKIKKVLNIKTDKLLDNKNISTFIKTKSIRSTNTSFVLFTSLHWSD